MVSVTIANLSSDSTVGIFKLDIFVNAITHVP
jgi:hypothetical protein